MYSALSEQWPNLSHNAEAWHRWSEGTALALKEWLGCCAGAVCTSNKCSCVALHYVLKHFVCVHRLRLRRESGAEWTLVTEELWCTGKYWSVQVNVDQTSVQVNCDHETCVQITFNCDDKTCLQVNCDHALGKFVSHLFTGKHWAFLCTGKCLSQLCIGKCLSQLCIGKHLSQLCTGKHLSQLCTGKCFLQLCVGKCHNLWPGKCLSLLGTGKHLSLLHTGKHLSQLCLWHWPVCNTLGRSQKQLCLWHWSVCNTLGRPQEQLCCATCRGKK